MKILYVTTISNTIGFLVPHIKLLNGLGHRVDIACNVVREVNYELLDMGCKVHDVEFQRSPLKRENYSAYKKIKDLVIREGYDIVHTHTPIASFLTRLACRNIPDLKILYTAHGFHFYKGAPLKNWMIYYSIEKLAARWTDGLITMNEEDYEIAKKFKYRKSNAVHKVNGVGVNLDRFSPQTIKRKSELREKYGYMNDEFILFYAAELNKNKHQDLIIEVIKELKEEIPNIKLILAGGGSLLKEYKTLAEFLNVEDYVEFLGYRRDIKELLVISDIAVASSRREGLPVNVMEAMSTGLPLVVTDVRGHRDLVKDEENGYLVGVNDKEGFVDSIEKLYKDSDLIDRFGKESIELSKNYSIESVMKNMKEIYFDYLE